MTTVLADLHLLDEFDQPKLWSGCLFCGWPMADRSHGDCRERLRWSSWEPCLVCYGSRTNGQGETCLACFGVGFIEHEHHAGLLGAGYVAAHPAKTVAGR